ncbi:MAG TPA: DUF1553 domain-containing protein, partial [Pirellulaceae bacterium]|nr:DUF1553 domain-containing protein [Pirellulaceae bacterium]
EMYRRHESQIAALQRRIKSLKDGLKVAASSGKAAPDPTRGPGPIAAKDLPGIVIDDADAKRVGEWKLSQFHATYVGAGYLHDLDTGKGEKTLTFQPEFPKAGRYEVRLAYAPGANRTAEALVTVFSADGEKELRIDQRGTPPIDQRWVSLGEYRFEANGQGFVIVSNEGAKGHVIADAVQFLPLDAAVDAKPSESKPSDAKPSDAKPGDAKSSETPAVDAEVARKQQEQEIKRLEAEVKQLTERGPKRPMYMSVKEEDADEVGDTQVHIRGVVHNLGDAVPRGFIQVAMQGAAPTLPQRESGRRELGLWLAARENPLTARVFVNRLWHWTFGVGLVRTTDNFGSTGEPPSHPELLDDLTLRFVDGGWSVKRLVRELVTSRAYRLSETRPQRTGEFDPENRLLSHAHRRRLDAESLLDGLLSASGRLTHVVGGSTIKSGTAADYGYVQDSSRRAVYWPVLRNALPDLFEAFDFADPSMVVGRRSTSTVAPQALFLMNHPLVVASAKQTVRRLEADEPDDDGRRLVRAYRLLLGREPTERERTIALEYVRSDLGASGGGGGGGANAGGAGGGKAVASDKLGGNSRSAAWGRLVQALIASVDFRYQ